MPRNTTSLLTKTFEIINVITNNNSEIVDQNVMKLRQQGFDDFESIEMMSMCQMTEGDDGFVTIRRGDPKGVYLRSHLIKHGRYEGQTPKLHSIRDLGDATLPVFNGKNEDSGLGGTAFEHVTPSEVVSDGCLDDLSHRTRHPIVLDGEGRPSSVASLNQEGVHDDVRSDVEWREKRSGPPI